ncbi:MAG: hypothetical protein AB1938_22425, partial [Myxococcota bacterium]
GGPSCHEPGGTPCNTIAVSPTWVSVQRSSATPPAPAGGTLTGGRYVMTSVVLFTTDGGAGPTGARENEAFELATNTVQSVVQREVEDGGCEVSREAGTVTFAGTQLTYASTCPGGGAGGMSYTATSSTLVLFQDEGGLTRIVTYTRQ